MQRLICLLALVLPAPAAVAAPAAPSAPRTNYNVLLIISDDLKAELGCYGSPIAKTPCLDKLASSGVRFDRGYCQYPLCCPARTSMLTGRKPTTSGVVGNRTWFGELHPDYITLPRYFKDHGYVSARTGKIFHDGIDDTDAWDEGGEARYLAGAPKNATARQVRRPSTNATEQARENVPSRASHSDRVVIVENSGENEHDYRVATKAVELLRQYKDRPFFIACGFSTPHSPLTAPRRFFDLYDPAKIPLPPDFAARPTVPPGFPKQAIRPRNADLFINRDATPDEARQVIRGYLAAVSWVDFNVGRVLDGLDSLGLRDNTIVVFWGDQGYQLGEKGKWSKAGSLFEAVDRVPFIIRAPGLAGNGKPCGRVVESLDFYPTLVELCGLPPAPGVEGRSLVPLLKKPSTPWDHPAYTVWSEDGVNLRGVAVRTEKWRYAEFEDGGAMLLDPENDPKELKNRADDPKLAGVRAELSKLVQAYRAGYVPPREAPKSSQVGD